MLDPSTGNTELSRMIFIWLGIDDAALLLSTSYHFQKQNTVSFRIHDVGIKTASCDGFDHD